MSLTIYSWYQYSGSGVGSVICITGIGFDATTVPWFEDKNGSLFIQGTVQSWTTTQPDGDAEIYIVVPAGAYNGVVRLVNSDNSYAQITNYIVGPAPTITSFTPTWGAGGTTITINGTNFVGPNLAFWMYNDNWGTITSSSPTQIVGTVGAVIPPYYTTEIVVRNAYDNVTSTQFYNYTTTTTTAAPTTTTTTTTLTPNVTLNISYSSGQWTASLSAAVGSALTLSNLMVLGYTTTTCSGGAVDSDAISLTIPAGSLSATQTSNGLSCIDKKYKFSGQLTVNGTPHANNAAFSVGSQTVTVKWSTSTCSAYPC